MINQLRIAFSEILRGNALLEMPDFSGIFIKHLNSFDILEVDCYYEEAYQKAINSGIVSEKERLFFLEKENIWGKKEEESIKSLNETKEALVKSKIKCFIIQQKEQFQEAIDKTNKELKILENKKQTLIGLTAENYATKKSNEHYLYISLYKNNLKDKYFSFEEFDNLEEEKLQKIIKYYNQKIDKYSTENLKQIAISNFFINSFCLAEDDTQKYYGKPIVDLTFYQTELFIHGKIFKSIFTENFDKIDKTILNDPDKILEWHKTSVAAQDTLKGIDNKESLGGSAIVGATKEDLKALGIENEGVSLSAELNKAGRSLTFQEIIDLHS